MLATENDSPSTLLLCCLGHLLTNTAQIFADLRTYWSSRCGEAGDRASAQSGDRFEGGLLHLN